MRDHRVWWAPMEGELPVLTGDGFALISLWLFGEMDLDIEESFQLNWEDFLNKFCVIEQLWAERNGYA